MPGSGVARSGTLRVASALLGVTCGWWLFSAALEVAAWVGLQSRPDALRWLLLMLFSLDLLVAVLCVPAVRGLRHGSRTAWRVGLALFVATALQGVVILVWSPLGVPLVMVGGGGAGLMLTRSVRRRLTATDPDVAVRVRRRRRVVVAVSAVGVLAWYAFAGFNLAVATGRLRVDDRPPCDPSTRYADQTVALWGWMTNEAPAQGLPIDSADASICRRNLLPGVATGQISAGGVAAVRSGLERLGCVWHDDFCTVTVNEIRAKARIHDGSRPTLQLWPAS
jgi:hypothetical protein